MHALKVTMKGNGMKEIKRYKIQVIGSDYYGCLVDIPQLKGCVSVDKETGEHTFCSYSEMQEATGESISTVEDFVEWMKNNVKEEVEISYEVIGTYEES